MATNVSIIKIDAPIQKVWDALTTPALVKRWQYGSDLQTDWKIGSKIKYVAQWEGKTMEQWGTVLEFIPLKK